MRRFVCVPTLRGCRTISNRSRPRSSSSSRRGLARAAGSASRWLIASQTLERNSGWTVTPGQRCQSSRSRYATASLPSRVDRASRRISVSLVASDPTSLQTRQVDELWVFCRELPDRVIQYAPFYRGETLCHVVDDLPIADQRPMRKPVAPHIARNQRPDAARRRSRGTGSDRSSTAHARSLIDSRRAIRTIPSVSRRQ